MNQSETIRNAVIQFVQLDEVKTIIGNIKFPEKKQYIMGNQFSIDCHVYEKEVKITAKCNGEKGFTEFIKTYGI